MAHGNRLSMGGVAVSSAGTRAVIGDPIHPEAVQVLDHLGGDPFSFRARQLTARIASSADLIVTMTRSHRDSVLGLAPSKLHRTFTLAEVSQLVSRFDPDTVADLSPLRSRLTTSDVVDVPDPMGRGPEVFEAAATLILELLPPVMAVCARSAR